ncbi:MAG: hypothetical protein A2Y62_08925 [Candidatus Fischerbacteria bacterium RBG_13_37_8]|uniref:Uncharacterized protein n=1 Tax=Candidatus Fischerbacteria bacterium RBG_13_37_8 TaxID=1817863 RepID=A0A1F5VUU0_9BACT|nr:MAG: hypothetical protein A2Y62_08925 [Candidatus Fischerbacteria bacterium RBG_13_37_8]
MAKNVNNYPAFYAAEGDFIYKIFVTDNAMLGAKMSKSGTSAKNIILGIALTGSTLAAKTLLEKAQIKSDFLLFLSPLLAVILIELSFRLFYRPHFEEKIQKGEKTYLNTDDDKEKFLGMDAHNFHVDAAWVRSAKLNKIKLWWEYPSTNIGTLELNLDFRKKKKLVLLENQSIYYVEDVIKKIIPHLKIIE